MTAFLEKLRKICKTCPKEIAGWSESGTEFEVRSREFEKYLKNYFKGSIKTFIRQLHFYGFTKSEAIDGKWTFSHPKFTQNNPDGILQITRKTKLNSVSFATKDEISRLKEEMKVMRNTFNNEVTNMNNRINELTHLMEKTMSEESSKNCNEMCDSQMKANNPQDFFFGGYNYNYGSVATECDMKPKLSPSLSPSTGTSVSNVTDQNKELKRCWSVSSKSTLDAHDLSKKAELNSKQRKCNQRSESSTYVNNSDNVSNPTANMEQASTPFENSATFQPILEPEDFSDLALDVFSLPVHDDNFK